MGRIRVAVVYGGRSSEHGISVVSAGSVIAALDPAKYEVVPVGITPAGAWVLTDGDAAGMAGPESGQRDIERALASLVPEQRAVLMLVVLEGLSYREIAEVQGVPIGTVMSRLARARAQIKSYLDGERPALRRVK